MKAAGVFKMYADGIDEATRANTAWIQTFRGRQFFPLTPRKQDVCIEDLAHSLACQCRFTGHTREFYCVTPETRVLTASLEWVPAGLLRLGQPLIGFDENTPGERVSNIGGTGKAKPRKLAPSHVLHTGRIKRQVWKLTLSDGTTLRSSAEHPWLITSKQSKNQKWETTERIAGAVKGTHSARGRLRPGKRFMLRFLEPWSTDTTQDAGYLAGMLDGEGCVSSNGEQSTYMAQKQNKPYREVQRILSARGYRFADTQAETGVHTQFPAIQLLEVIDAVCEGEQEVVALETSTHTYFAEGFGAHNSTAEHSVKVSWVVGLLGGDLDEQLHGLIHDGGEAYLADIARPVKHDPSMHFYREAEGLAGSVVAEAFGLEPQEPAIVKHADNIMLGIEARDQMTPHPAWDKWINMIPAGLGGLNVHTPWEWREAEDMFLKRYRVLRERICVAA